MTRPFFSVVIPVRDDPENLSASLAALDRSAERAFETIVVDDGSRSSACIAVAKDAGAKVIGLDRSLGPAGARNRGVEEAGGEVIVFLDADVEVAVNTLTEIRLGFEERPDLVALFGSYDRQPSGQNLLSQYRNLLHHYTHQKSRAHAFTFWSGCGAIRRKEFLEYGGFEDRFRHPSIEDIELGQRLTEGGAQIRLRRSVLVRHRKIWRFFQMMRCDLFDRGIPWTRELLRLGRIPADMNMRYSDRLLAFVAFLLTLLLAAVVVKEPLWALVPVAVVVSLVVADRTSSPGGLGMTRWWPLRVVSVIECLGLLGIVALTPGTWLLVGAGLGLLMVFLVVRADFYRILLSVRGFAFLFLSFQAHVLFYWICGLSFLIGSLAHLVRPLEPLPKLEEERS